MKANINWKFIKLCLICSALSTLNLQIHSAIENDSDKLIFPDPKVPIRIVKAVDYRDKTPVGEYISADDKLVEKILAELNLPFNHSVIRLNQCARNFVSDKNGPNVLLLSANEGGFPRCGLIIRDNGKEITYPNLCYVDLVVNEKSISEAILSIYSHELGHVMMMNILEDLPRGQAVLQHVGMGITDYSMAFNEGWGEHFQVFAFLDVPVYNSYFTDKNRYSNISLLWHSNMDSEQRINAALQGRYIFQKMLPDNIDIGSLNPEQVILLYHTSPYFNTCKLKNAQQMLSNEGMLSSLFYLINSNPSIRNKYKDINFYNKFLLSPVEAGTKPQDIFTPYENAMLKNFYVWSRMKGQDNNTPIFIRFLNEWCSSFPEDKDAMLDLFIRATIGKTVTNEAGAVYEQAAFSGMIGDYQTFNKLRTKYNEMTGGIIKDVIESNLMLEANIGNEIWIENKNLKVRRTLWSDKNMNNLMVNLNTASEYEIASFPGIGLKKAKEIINAREKIGSFKTLEEAEKYGFVIKMEGSDKE